VRIAVVTNQAPFIRGGAELLADELVTQLTFRGIEAAVIRLPFAWDPPARVLDHMLSARLLRLGNIDRVIAMKFPAYFVHHEEKVLWLLHQFRQAYDLWGSPLGSIPDTPEGRALRDAVITADNRFIPEARRVFTNNRVVSDRLLSFNGIPSEVLYPPLIDAGDFSCTGYGDFIFYPSRIGPAKRQLLAAESMLHVHTHARLVIAGPADTPNDLQRLLEFIERKGLQNRVEVKAGWLPHAEKVALYAAALGVMYIPFDEDSYGYVTLEAYGSRKPVISCTDSGGTRDVVIHDETGFALPPDPVRIAEAVDALARDPARARRMGEAGHDHVNGLGISWDRVVERLLS
jgi:glycosyltransferase involved in cell wall biosynthesis